jgi:GTPase SAR1 family protein
VTAIIYVFDLALKRTLDSIDMWLKEAKDTGLNKDCVLYLVGNKVIHFIFRKINKE